VRSIDTPRRSSPSFFAPLRWSLLDKKRVENIVRSFSDRNDRLHEKVKLWCLASQLGVQLEHLQHLQQDETSKRLGFDKDATLRLVQWDAQNMERSLELTDPSWDEFLKQITNVEHQGMFKMFLKDGVTMIQENHSYDEPRHIPDLQDDAKPPTVDLRTRNRIDSLAKLLRQPKYLSNQKSIAFVFEVQPKPEGEPISLLRLLFDPDRRPALGDKFRLALGLSRAVSQIHMVKWVRFILDGARPDTDLQRCTKAFEVRIYSCFQTQGRQRKMPSALSNTLSLGFWASSSVDQSHSSQLVRQTLSQVATSTGILNGKGSLKRYSRRFTTSMPLVWFYLK
jgi:hypothetical protein